MITIRCSVCGKVLLKDERIMIEDGEKYRCEECIA